MLRLSRANLPRARHLGCPNYEPGSHGIGHVHLGLGAFHRAHQYTHKTLAGGDGRIMAVSMRSAETAGMLEEQDCLYQLEQTDADGRTVEAVANIARALSLRDAREEIKAQLAVPGLIVQALENRRNSGAGGLAVLSCDYLPDNGVMTRTVVVGFAAARDPSPAAWMRYALANTENETCYDLRDPMESQIVAALAGTRAAEDMLAAFNELPGLIPRELRGDQAWNALVVAQLSAILDLRGSAEQKFLAN